MSSIELQTHNKLKEPLFQDGENNEEGKDAAAGLNKDEGKQNIKDEKQNGAEKKSKTKQKVKKVRYNRNDDQGYKNQLIENRKAIRDEGDLDVIPADFDLAKKHREVLRIRKLDEQEEKEEEERKKKKKKKKDEQDQQQQQQQQQDQQEQNPKPIDEEDKCLCCGRSKILGKVEFRTKNLDLSFLGPAFPLHFDFMEACIYLLLLIFVVTGLYNTISNAKSGSSCVDSEDLKSQLVKEGYSTKQAEKLAANQCQLNWISKFTLGNRRNQSDTLLAQELLNLLSILVIIVYIQFFMRRQRKYSILIDKKTVSPSDYTVFVTQIQKRLKLSDKPTLPGKPPSNYLSYRECILDYFESESGFGDLKDKIADISFCYNIDELTANEEKRINLLKIQQEKLIKEEQENNENHNNNNNKVIDNKDDQEEKDLENLQDQINLFQINCFEGYKGEPFELKDKDKEQKDKIIEKKRVQIIGQNKETSQAEDIEIEKKIFQQENEEFMRTYFVGQAFLSFKTQQDATDFLYKVKIAKKKFRFQGKDLQFERAPDPTDINWHNLYMKKTMRMVRFGGGFLFNIGTIVIASISIYYLAKLQYSYTNSNSIAPTAYEKAMIQLISFGISMMIIVINEVLVRVVDIFNQIKKFRMKTSQSISYAIFLSSAQFINSTVIPLLLLIMVSSADSYYSILYSPTGLILNQNSIFITNAFMPIVMYFVDPVGRWKQYKRYSEEKKRRCWLSQRDLQLLFQDPEFQLSTQYASAIKTIYMTFFYLSVMPLCMLWSAVALFVQYCTSKQLLASKRVVLVSLSEKLSLSIIILLKIALIIYACTSYLFLRLSNSLDNPYATSLVGIAISVIHFCIPLQTFNEWVFKEHKLEQELFSEENIQDNNLSYEDAREKQFSTDYVSENPALKKKNIKYGNKITRKQIVQQNDYEKMKQNQKNKKIQEKAKKAESQSKKQEIVGIAKHEEVNDLSIINEECNISKKTLLDKNKLTDLTLETKINQRMLTNQSQSLFTNSSLIPQLGFMKEPLENIKQKLVLQSFNTINEGSIEENKKTLSQYFEFSDCLNKRYKAYESKLQNNTLSKADLKEILQIEELLQLTDEKTKNIRIQLAEKMKKERKPIYLDIKTPEEIKKEISSINNSEQPQKPEQIQQEYKKMFGIYDWIASYFKNYDTKLIDNKDYLGNSQEVADIEELKQSLIKRRIKLVDTLEKSMNAQLNV